jgi:hypothetical protein
VRNSWEGWWCSVASAQHICGRDSDQVCHYCHDHPYRGDNVVVVVVCRVKLDLRQGQRSEQRNEAGCGADQCIISKVQTARRPFTRLGKTACRVWGGISVCSDSESKSCSPSTAMCYRDHLAIVFLS